MRALGSVTISTVFVIAMIAHTLGIMFLIFVRALKYLHGLSLFIFLDLSVFFLLKLLVYTLSIFLELKVRLLWSIIRILVTLYRQCSHSSLLVLLVVAFLTLTVFSFYIFYFLILVEKFLVCTDIKIFQIQVIVQRNLHSKWFCIIIFGFIVLTITNMASGKSFFWILCLKLTWELILMDNFGRIFLDVISIDRAQNIFLF